MLPKFILGSSQLWVVSRFFQRRMKTLFTVPVVIMVWVCRWHRYSESSLLLLPGVNTPAPSLHWPLIVTRELGSDWLWCDSRTALPATSAQSLCTINIGINNVSGKSRSRLAVERDKPGTLISFHKVCLKTRVSVMSSEGVQCLHLLNKFQPWVLSLFLVAVLLMCWTCLHTF